MKKILALTLCNIITLAFASNLDKQAINVEQQFIHKNDKIIEQTQQQKTKSNPTKNSLSLNSEQLLANPDLLKLAMQSVLINQQADAIDTILPLYKKLPDAIPLVVDYANALKAFSLADYKKAIIYYRKVIAKNPQLQQVRLNLAIALYADQQNNQALHQFHKILAENPEKSVAVFIQKNIESIKQQQQWQFSLNFYYNHEKNINNAPKHSQQNINGVSLIFEPPETANGVHLDLEANKKFYLNHSQKDDETNKNHTNDGWKNNIYSIINLSSNSDYYWDNQKYNDYILTAGLGLGYSDSKFTFEIQPFSSKRFLYNKQYSANTGASLYFKYYINNNWNFSSFNQYSYERLKGLSIQNGKRLFNALSISLSPNSRQLFMLNLAQYKSRAKYSEDSYKRSSVSFIYAQELNLGISTNLNLSLAKKKYNGVDFFNIKRQDREYSVKFSIWNRAWHIYNITPRLVFSLKRTKSNHFYYDDRRENSLRLEFNKSF